MSFSLKHIALLFFCCGCFFLSSVCVRACVRAYVRAYVRACVRACMRACVPACNYYYFVLLMCVKNKN